MLLCVALAAVALAASGSPRAKPPVSLSAPAEVLSGAQFVVAGSVSPDAPGQVVVQVNRGGGWRPLGRSRLRGHRFKVTCALTGEGAVSLRATLGSTSRSSTVRSAPRRVAIRAAQPAPASEPAPASPQTAPPSAAAAQVAPPAPAPESAPASEPPASVPDLYWGAWFDGNPTPEDTAARERFEGSAGKSLSILEAYSSWASCASTCTANQSFPTAVFEKIRAYGAIPLLSWASESNGAVEEPEFQLADIIEGKYDAYIEAWAREAKAWGHPFFLRFDWEMNGTWFPWSERENGNQPGEFVTAWRHVHDIFARVGATNVSWVWSPFANPNGSASLVPTSTLYPGNAYVDWTGIDGYNRGTSSAGSRWRTFDEVFAPDYDAITTTIAPSKPMLLPEVASSESGGSKAAWIEEMFAQLPTAFPDVRGFLWFDHEEEGHEWPIESSPAATAAFAAGVADPRYLSNSLGALPDGPVPVPPG